MLDKANFKRRRTTHGIGLCTTIPIAKGATVIEYTGEKITADEANERGGQYLFELNDKYTIDGKEHNNLSRYINHSCRPNCEAELSEDETQVFINAKRNIKAGEELTYDYGKEFWKTYIKPKGCRCVKCAVAK